MELKVGGFMTAPRYEAVYARNIIENAFKCTGIPLTVSGGVFYGQCMQMMFEDAIKKGIEIAVTVDFDSLFTQADLMRLIRNLVENPAIDALASLQSRRGMRFPLLTRGQDTEIATDGSPFLVSTAHFGLTAIRLDRLKDIPLPWFWSKPTSKGHWQHDDDATDRKMDDDIWFWHQWAQHGRTVAVDPSVSIGHLEEVVACFDETGKHQFMYTKEWLAERELNGE